MPSELADKEPESPREVTWTQRFDWLHDFSLPDLTPLLETMKHHWKIAIAAISSAAIFALMTYLLGPVVIITTVKVIFLGLQAAAKLICMILESIFRICRRM
ncbi:hypothetical protein Y032_0076g1006 [Ancylostoma ceylanicum]|nr:hypothetical protein Y032_0076g1006 [Ancylostoma ceylanicum]